MPPTVTPPDPSTKDAPTVASTVPVFISLLTPALTVKDFTDARPSRYSPSGACTVCDAVTP